MKFILNNISTQVISGGRDGLVGDVEKTLREYLRVRPMNYFRNPSFKNRGWDGYKYFINRKLEFPTGFFPSVAKYMQDSGFKVEMEDLRQNLPIFKETFVEQIGIHTLRPYQVPLVKAANNYIIVGDQSIYFPRGVIDAATNSGKTGVIAGIFNNLEPCRALFLIHNQDIYDEMVDYYSSMYSIGQINAKNYHIGDFTVAMVKTLCNRLQDSMNVRHDLATMKALFVDEAHRSGGDEYLEVLKAVGAGLRISVSGTPLGNEDKVKNMLIIGISGPSLAKVSNKFLIDNKYSLPPIITVHLNDVWEPGYNSYETEFTECVQYSSKRFNDTVAFIDERPGKKVVIAFEEILHGEWLYESLKGAYPDLSVQLVHGKDKDRKRKITEFKAGKIDILISSTILQEGLNLPNMQILIWYIAGKSLIRVKQYIGRLLRTDGESQYVEMLDWFDLGKYVSVHSRKRMKIYKTEEFQVEFKYPCRKNGTPIRENY